MEELYELKEKLLKELKDYAGNVKYSREDVETIKYLASAIDHICNISEDDGYSGYYPRGSYARRRDSMGRYSGEHGYSRNGLVDKLRDLMDDAPDDHTRTEIKRLIDKM